jgi:hypothetical protein
MAAEYNADVHHSGVSNCRRTDRRLRGVYTGAEYNGIRSAMVNCPLRIPISGRGKLC